MNSKKYLLLVFHVFIVLFFFVLNIKIYAMSENDDFNEIILSETEIIESINDLLQK